MLNTRRYGFYSINPDYLQFLNQADAEVYYSPKYATSTKPFLGIVVGIEDYNYFIPLSSAKEKHKKWKNTSNEHFLVYEKVSQNHTVKGNIYKLYSPTEKLHIMSVLDIKKMIPVPESEYFSIDFDKIEDEKYKDLIQKEYNFCLSIKDKVLIRAEKIYRYQKETGIVKTTYCNFKKLEQQMSHWKK